MITNETATSPAVYKHTHLCVCVLVQLVRMVLEAPGWAGVFCAAREVIVERMCKTEENRAYVVMFNSSDDLQLRAKACGPCKLLYGGVKGKQQQQGAVNGPVPPASMQQRQVRWKAFGQHHF